MRKDENEQNEIARPAGKHFAQVDDSKAEPCCAGSAAPASKVRKRLWAVAVLLCAVAIVVGTYLTYTAFLAGDFLKSVAVSGTSQALFASDMLTGYTSENLNDGEIAVRSVIADTSGQNCSFTFRIYNHLLGDKNKVNDKDVNATLSVRATGTTKAWNISGEPALTADGTVNLSFPANKATMYTYTVTFAKDDLNKASFLVKAAVDSANSPGTNLKLLAANIAPAERAKVTASGVSGEWVDENSDDTNFSNFDAYNYRVTVTGAPTKIKLTWGDKVEHDPFLATNHSDATFDGRSVTFTMDPGSEIITFYRAKDTAPGSWEDIGVTCRAA